MILLRDRPDFIPKKEHINATGALYIDIYNKCNAVLRGDTSTSQLYISAPRGWGKTHLCLDLMSNFSKLHMIVPTYMVMPSRNHKAYHRTHLISDVSLYNIDFVIFDEIHPFYAKKMCEWLKPKRYIVINTPKGEIK